MRFLKQSTSVDVKIGPFLDETDGKTAETALTITQPDIRLAKNGGAWAQKNAAQTLSHEEAGWYEVTLDATDTDTVGCLMVAVHESGALPVWHEFHVLEEAVYDALIAASAPGYLQPTTAGRTLDVTATGAAGVDWGNVENVSTANNLSGTSVGTAAAVTTLENDAITAGALSTAANNKIADQVWDEARSGHTTDGTFGQVNQVVRSGTAQGGGTNTITLDASASAVDDFYNGVLVWAVGGTGAGQAGVVTDYVGSTKVATVDNNWRTNPDNTTIFVLLPGSLGLTSATLASAVWGAARSSYTTAGTFGEGVELAADAVDAAALATDAVTEIQSGLATAAALTIVDDFLDTEIAAIKTKTDFLPSATAGAAGGLFIAGSNAATTVNVTGNITGNLSGSVGSVTGAVGSVTAGVTLAASAVQAIWDAATSALTTVGSIGKRLVDYLTGDIYARLGAPAGASMSADIAAVKSDTAAILVDTGTTLDARIPAALVGGRMDCNVGAISTDSVAADNAEAFFDGTGYAGTGNVIPTVTTVTGGALSTQVDALEAAVIAIEADTQDIQARLPAALTAGGNIKADALAISGDTVAADNLEAAADGTGYNLGGGSVVAASVTGNLGGTLTSTERNAIADALLNRGLDGAGASSRKVREAMAFSRNKWTISGTTLTVYDVDDTTVLYTATISSASGNPVTGVDPAT